MMQSEAEPQPNARVGDLLRNRRLRAGLDLAEVSRCLRIRQPFLDAIETGRFEALPAPAYALGFVRSYAEQLGLDADDIARRVKSEIADRSAKPLHFPLPIAPEAGAPKGAVMLIGAVIAIGAYAGWYLTSTHPVDMAGIVAPVPERLEQLLNEGQSAQPATASQPSVDRPVLSTAREIELRSPSAPGMTSPVATSAAPTGVAVPVTQPIVPSATPPVFEPANVADQKNAALSGELMAAFESVSPHRGQTGSAMAAEPADQTGSSASDATTRIVLKAKADSWVEVRDPATKATLLARLLKSGDVYEVPDKPGLELLTGNAGGLVVMVDGQLAPPFGRDGAVRRGIPLDADSLRSAIDGSGPR